MNQSFIQTPGYPCGVAAVGNFVYWVNGQTGSVGRAALSGADVEQNFIPGAQASCGVAVDSGHIYWADGFGIGRASIDGSAVDPAFLPTLGSTTVAINDRYIYWTRAPGKEQSFVPSIGRATLNGRRVNQRLISLGSMSEAPHGVAVGGGHIYWTNVGSGDTTVNTGTTIGRANLDGSGVKPDFIGGATNPCGPAVDATNLYWHSGGKSVGPSPFSPRPGDAIGRASLDATSIDQAFIMPAASGCGVGLDTPAPPPSNALLWDGIARNKRRGTAVLRVEVFSPGALVVRGSGINATRAQVAGGGVVKLSLRPTRAVARRLSTAKRAKVTAHVSLTPTGGLTRTHSRTIRLIKRA